jgi:hypothetical protein
VAVTVVELAVAAKEVKKTAAAAAAVRVAAEQGKTAHKIGNCLCLCPKEKEKKRQIAVWDFVL